MGDERDCRRDIDFRLFSPCKEGRGPDRSQRRSIKMPLSQMLSISSRVTCPQFWLYSLGQSIVVEIIASLLADVFRSSFDPVTGPPALFWVLVGPLYVLSLWIAICINGKRCHDRNGSAWFILIAFIPPDRRHLAPDRARLSRWRAGSESVWPLAKGHRR